MARKHKKHSSHKRRSSRRRGGIGAINMSSIVTKVAGIAGGAVLARMANNSLGSKLDPKIAAIATTAVGAMVPKFMMSQLGEAIGDGFIAVGLGA